MHTCSVGHVAAAASFLQALDGLCHVAHTLGEVDDAARWEAALGTLRRAFDDRFWHAATRTYGDDAGTVQTVNTLALAAGVAQSVSADRQARATAALLDDAVREKMLTTGNVGSAQLLSTLSSLGSEVRDGCVRVGWHVRPFCWDAFMYHRRAQSEFMCINQVMWCVCAFMNGTLAVGVVQGHDAALAIVSRQEYPGWGYWVTQGATTCWEGWSTLDATKDHYRGTAVHPTRQCHAVCLCVQRAAEHGTWRHR